MFVSWVRWHSRSALLAERLGIEAHFVAVGRGRNSRTVAFRYVAQAGLTLRLILTRRPRVLVVMAPPLPLVALASAFAPVVVDAHSAAVLRPDGTIKSQFVWLARRARLVLVTTEALATSLERLGVDSVAVHDPPFRATGANRSEADRPQVVFPAGWAPDEPVEALVAAAHLVPHTDVVLTGLPDRRRLDPLEPLPPNVRLAGFLDDDAYDALLASAAAVLALTTRELTMQRSGYEAMAHGVPLVASATGALREYFTAGTVFVDPWGTAIAAGIEAALAQRGELADAMLQLREQRIAAFDERLDDLRARILSEPAPLS